MQQHALDMLAALDAQGMAACFALNAASFLIVIWALMSLHIKHIPTTNAGSMRDQMGTGLSYVRNHGSLVALIVLAATTTFLGFAVLTFLPVFAQSVFHQGASTYSHLMAFSGAGSIVGTDAVAKASFWISLLAFSAAVSP